MKRVKLIVLIFITFPFIGPIVFIIHGSKHHVIDIKNHIENSSAAHIEINSGAGVVLKNKIGKTINIICHEGESQHTQPVILNAEISPKESFIHFFEIKGTHSCVCEYENEKKVIGKITVR